MASKPSIVDFLVEQMAGAGPVSARKMFGEYGVYCGAKLVALICDDELFVKPTPSGKALLGDVDERPPYPGAKPYIWIAVVGLEGFDVRSDAMNRSPSGDPRPRQGRLLSKEVRLRERHEQVERAPRPKGLSRPLRGR